MCQLVFAETPFSCHVFMSSLFNKDCSSKLICEIVKISGLIHEENSLPILFIVVIRHSWHLDKLMYHFVNFCNVIFHFLLLIISLLDVIETRTFAHKFATHKLSFLNILSYNTIEIPFTCCNWWLD